MIKSNKAKAILIFLIFIGIISVVGYTSNNKSPENKSKNESKTEQFIRKVKYIQIKPHKNIIQKEFSGIAEADIESNLSFKVSGNLINKYFNVGDHVSKGQLLASIDTEPFQIELQAAKAELEQANAQLNNAISSYERASSLYVNESISKSDLDNARAAYGSATAVVKALKEKIRLTNLKMNYTNLYAPSAGYISSVEAEVNENVQAGQKVAILQSGSSIKIKLAIPESLIFKINNGQKVSVIFDALPDNKFSGVVTEIGPAATDIMTTYPVYVRLSSTDKRIKPGMAAKVNYIFSNDKQDKLIVPLTAICEDRKGKYAFIATYYKNELFKISRKNVETGQLYDQGIEILNGISPGDKLITAGISKIQDGQIVKIEGLMDENN